MVHKSIAKEEDEGGEREIDMTHEMVMKVKTTLVLLVTHTVTDQIEQKRFRPVSVYQVGKPCLG